MVAEDELSIGLGGDFYAGIGAADGGGGEGGRGGGRGLMRTKERKRPIEAAVNKEGEQRLESDDQCVVMGRAAAGGNGGGGSSELPRPVDGLPENGPPPFLTKTYEMVEDPETDPIVSWADGSNNFVVWDAHNFAMNLLPKYFKHSNFSSFIRQLNTYGFRKVHLDRWEFGNAGFQRGKKHMLKTIKRRNRSCSSKGGTNKKLVERETENERLKKENDMLKLEILDLKRRQEETDKHVADLEECMRCVERKQHVMVMFIAKSMGQTSFVQKLLSKYKQRSVLGSGGVPKKRSRFVMNESNEIFSSLKLNLSNKDKEKLAEMQCEKNFLLGSNLDGDYGPTQEQQNTNLTPETSSLDFLSSYVESQLMEDDVTCESERDALGGSDFLHGFKDSLIHHSTWE